MITMRGLCVLLVLAALASPAAAATITIFDSYGSTLGGEFRATASGLPFTPGALLLDPADTFETFCVEANEYISFGSIYYADVSTAAVNGGLGGGNPDPLDPLTAYLYTKFITGSLAGYSYDAADAGGLRTASANALQQVIWYIEGEASKVWVDGDASLMNQFYQDAFVNAGPDIGNVRVLNLWGDEARTQPAQDQLILIPEPATLLLALGGLMLLSRSRRRR